MPRFTIRPHHRALLLTIAALGLVLASATARAQTPRPVQVFLLAGQSNMEGKGAVNTLAWLGEDPQHGQLLATIRDADGNWVRRDDVWIDFLGRRGRLDVGYGSAGGPHGPLIGPEYGFGMVVGEHFEEPVLLVKTAWGGKDVANDFRAPGSGGPGPYYKRMIEHLRSAVGDLETIVPAAGGRGYELTGLVWFQGWNDMVNREKTAAYTENLAQMIRDLRKDLDAPNLPVVIGELGVGGDRASDNIMSFRAAQRAVADLPEFAGSVRYVRTAPFWDPVAQELYDQDVWKGPEKDRFYRIASDRPYHYLGSGKIYFLMGRAFGQAMVELTGN
ncbi:MAG: sialate O-acetylesterase [Planctomycetota bacterium]|jgi:alpha-galactosidase